MKYMFLIYVPESDTEDGDPAVIDEHLAFTRTAIADGSYLGCDALQPPKSATTVRLLGGKIERRDGPFAETREVLGGFYVLDCATLDDAVAYAAKMPPARNGSIEVRPIATIPGWDEAVESMRAELARAGSVA